MSTPQVIDLRARLDFAPDAVILAQGDYPADNGLRHMIDTVPHLIICDGAVNGLLTHSSRRPDCVIGDGDSVPMDKLAELDIPFVHISDQETNDLTKSIKHCAERGWTRICILGGTGRREDHTIGNISLLGDYHKMGLEVRMMSDFGTFVPTEGAVTLLVEEGAQLSFFNIGGRPFSARGVKYPFEEEIFAPLWQATLNEATASEVCLLSSDVILVYVAQERKHPK